MTRFVALFIFLIGSAGLMAQELEIRSGFAEEFIVLGQTGRFVVTVQVEVPIGANEEEPAVEIDGLPEVKGLSYEAEGGSLQETGRRQMIINGRRSGSVIYQGRWTWKVTVHAEGRYQMPDVPLKVGGKLYRSRPNPAGFEVGKEAPGNRFVGAAVAITNTSPYVNQPIRLSYLLTSERTIVESREAEPQLEIPWAGSPPGFQAEPTVLAQPRDPSALVVVLGGERVPVSRDIFNDRKPPVIEVTLAKTLIPLAAGSIDLGGTKASLEIADSSQRTAFRGIEYGGRRKAFVTTPPITLEVRDAPKVGRPASYAGAMGDFRADLSYSSGKIRAGDSVELTLKLSGSDIVDLVAIPDIAAQFPNFRALASPRDARGAGPNREVIYSWFLKPLDNSVTEVPAFEFSWFSPQQEAFQAVKLAAMPLEISGEIEEGSVFGGSNRAERKSLAILGEGLRPLMNEPGALRSLQPTIPVAWFVVLLLVPAFSLLGLTYWTRSRARLSGDKNLQRKRKASKAAQERLAEAQSLLGQKGFHGKLARSLSGFIADKLGLPPASVSSATVRNLLGQAQLNPEVVDETANLLDELDHAAFGGTQATDAEERQILSRAEDLLGRLDREIRS